MSAIYYSTPIGEIPKDWHIVKLNELIEVNRGITYGIVQPGIYDPNGRFLVRGKDYSTGWAKPDDFFKVSEEIEVPYKRARLKENDLITTIVGAGVGNMQIVPKWLEGANITQTTARIAIDKSKGFYKFYYYILCSHIGKYNVRLFEKGGAQPGLNLADIKKYLIPLPSLWEQKKIAEILSTVDEKIDVIGAQITKTQELKKGLMQQLLTKGIGHTKFKDSPLGEMPLSWAVVRLGDIFKLSSGDSLSKNLSTDGKHAVYGGNGISFYHANYTHVESQIIIGRVGAYCGCIHKTKPKSWITDNALYIKEKFIDYYDDFIFYLLKKLDLNNFANKNAQPVISGQKIYPIQIALPSAFEQEKIAMVLNCVDEKLESLQTRKEQYQVFKKGLMQQLLTGKLRVNQTNQTNEPSKSRNLQPANTSH